MGIEEMMLTDQSAEHSIQFTNSQLSKNAQIKTHPEMNPMKSYQQSESHRKSANELYIAGKYEQAIDLYNQAIITAPSNSKEVAISLSNRSVTAEKLNQPLEALKDIAMALKMADSKEIDLSESMINKWRLRKEKLEKLSKTTSEDPEQPLFDGPNPVYCKMSSAIEIGHADNRGRLIKAVKDIPPGSLIMREKAWSWQIHEQFMESTCRYCCHKIHLSWLPCSSCSTKTVHYCSEHCRDADWIELHQYECIINRSCNNNNDDLQNGVKEKNKETQILGAHFIPVSTRIIAKTPIEQLEQFMKNGLEKSDTQFGMDSHSDYGDNIETMMSFVTFSSSDKELHLDSQQFVDNCLNYEKFLNHTSWSDCHTKSTISYFLHKLMNELIKRMYMNAYTMQSFEFMEPNRGPSNIGTAIFALGTLINHCCMPNTSLYFDGAIAEWRTTTFVKEGDELTASYGPRFGTSLTEQRQMELRMHYEFTCDCVACCDKQMRCTEAEMLSWICEACKSAACYKLNKGILCIACRHWQTYTPASVNERIRQSLSKVEQTTSFDQVISLINEFTDVFGQKSGRFRQCKVCHLCRVALMYPNEVTYELNECMQSAQQLYGHDASQLVFYHIALLKAFYKLNNSHQLLQIQKAFVSTWRSCAGVKGARQRWNDLGLFDNETFEHVMASIC